MAVAAGAGCSSRTDAQRAAPDPGLDSGVVHTLTGPVRGLVAADYRLFQGIPYAAPPTGGLRWAPPQPPQPWTGLRDASTPGPRCIQDTALDPGSGRRDSEDCLTVNVWTPAGAADRPVMVWIHGGGFANGSGAMYDASRLVERGDIVVVTFNYRLGALGFLAHPSLGHGNYGLLDQQAALRWVRDNISRFGGDPAKVTIAGESAGAMSVCDHLVARESAGLFRGAILQSGPCQAQAELSEARDVSLRYAAEVGCPDPATAAVCLRGLPATALEGSPAFFSIGADGLSGPVTGTPELPTDPAAALDATSSPRVPILIGTTRDEFTLFAALKFLRSGHAPTAAEYPKELSETFGADAAGIAQRYPLERYGGSVELAYSAAVTDGVFACPADRMSAAIAPHSPVYAYEFNDRTAPTPPPLREVPFPVGASHSLELRYLFDVVGAPALNADQQRLSDEMIGYWTEFVRTGEPGGGWPAYGTDPAWMSLKLGGSEAFTSFRDEHQCDFWAGRPG
ncbi:carboxylesterase/lipase family protein [Mycobacterium sp. ACS4331]|uniref:carboxylesterase/lipase family protein n=1 Tax=Mycobacterium sp. ACS4331 TaxID=1834121 RepID=UPI000801F490|nr:carboxylesterase/lipase family protein [Mycobacterium sp. ACS4331]OBF26175.1 carboxylesterase [Mycobacterium sp. ACS4331]